MPIINELVEKYPDVEIRTIKNTDNTISYNYLRIFA